VDQGSIWGIEVRGEPRQIVCKTLSTKKKKKNPLQKRAGGVAQGIGPEFKPSTTKTKKGLEVQDSEGSWVGGHLQALAVP
jgi:hypothetical protein